MCSFNESKVLVNRKSKSRIVLLFIKRYSGKGKESWGLWEIELGKRNLYGVESM